MKEFKTGEGTDESEDFFAAEKACTVEMHPIAGRMGEKRLLLRILDPSAVGVDQWTRQTCSATALEMEIGFGPGAFLIARGRNEPETTFIGFEVRTKQCSELLDRVNEFQMKNVWVIQTDARPVLQDAIEDGKLRELHVNFLTLGGKNATTKANLYARVCRSCCSEIGQRRFRLVAHRRGGLCKRRGIV